MTRCRNTLYKATGPDGLIVLRLTDTHHRTRGQVESELDFQYYLHANGTAVSQPLRATTGKYTVPFTHDGDRYVVSAFTYIPGQN